MKLRLFDLGFAVARLRVPEQQDKYEASHMTLFTPAEEGNSAQSVHIWSSRYHKDPEDANRLRRFAQWILDNVPEVTIDEEDSSTVDRVDN